MYHNAPVPSPRPAHAVSDKDRPQPPNGVIFPSAARAAATYTSDPIHNPGALGVRLFIAITDDGAAGTVTTEIQVKDPVSDTWKRLTGAVTTALTESGSPNYLTIYPGVTAAANIDVSTPLGPEWRVVAVVAANDVTFSIGAHYLI
jgi:hypothetical protein